MSTLATLIRSALRATATVAAAAALTLPAAAVSAADNNGAPRRGALDVTRYDVTDPNFGNMRVASMSIPAGWRATSQVRWDFGSANYPVHISTHVESPDGKMWIDLLPMDAVYWMDRMYQGIPVGQRSFGAVYAPNAGIDAAMQKLVVEAARGKMPGFQITKRQPIDAARMASAFNLPQLRGEAMTMHVRYQRNGAPAEEDFFSFYTAVQTLSSTGPQGTGHEYHRMLALSHSVGAVDGLLPSAYPLLATVASSIRPDEAYQQHIMAVRQRLAQQSDANSKRNYAGIAAAGARSRAISANNDAMIASMDRNRAAQNRADASRRAAAGGGGGGSSDSFSQMIRGTTRMSDPYWGTSEHDSNYSYHWTDSQGNYRASNDASFNPNAGAGGGANWQRMEAGR